MEEESQLERLEKELYKPKPQFGERQREFELRQKGDKNVPRFWSPFFLPPHDGGSRRINWRVLLLWSGIIIAFSFLVVYAIFVYLPTSFRTGDLQFTLYGQRNVRAGDTVTYTALLKNTSRLPVEDLVLTFEFPEGSASLDGQNKVQVKIPFLAAGGEASQDFKGHIIGQEGDVKVSKSRLSFKPQGTSSVLESEASFSSTVVEFPIRLDVALPQQVNPAEPVELTINYFSEAAAAWSDVAVEVEYPQGFTAFSTDPAPLYDNHWTIGRILPKAGGTIKIKGVVAEGKSPDLRFRVRIGVWKNDSKDWQVWTESVASSVLVMAPVEVTCAISGSSVPEQVVNPGDTLDVEVRFRNNTQERLQNVHIDAKLSGRGFDESNLLITDGSFDGGTHTVQWTPATNGALGELQTDGGGKVNFRMNVLDLPPRSSQDQNLSFAIDAKLTANRQNADEVHATSHTEIRLNSRLIFQSQAFWKGGVFAPRGPLPPQAGKQTFFTISWQLANLSNDVDGVVVRSLLPPNVKWEGLTDPDGAKISYNASTSEVRWEVGRIKTGAGFIRPALGVSFAVSSTPAATDVGKPIRLYAGPQVSGQDTFTKKTLGAAEDGKDSGSLSDAGFSFEKGVVKP